MAIPRALKYLGVIGVTILITNYCNKPNQITPSSDDNGHIGYVVEKNLRSPQFVPNNPKDFESQWATNIRESFNKVNSFIKGLGSKSESKGIAKKVDSGF